MTPPMTPGEFECPDCGNPAVVLSSGSGSGADGDALACCQGCGREHGRWAEILAARAAASPEPKRSLFAGWFLKGVRG
jgi:transcription elongation factor Elf1